MDKIQIIKIAMAVAIAVVVKEVVTVALKHSAPLMTGTSQRRSGVLRLTLRLFLVIFDAGVVGLSLWLMTRWLGDETSATRTFASLIALCSFCGVLSLINFRDGAGKFIEDLRARKKFPLPTEVQKEN